MNDRIFLLLIVTVHSIELEKYIKILNEDFPLENPKISFQLSLIEQYTKSFNKDMIQSINETYKDDIEEISSCFNDLVRGILKFKPKHREKELNKLLSLIRKNTP